MSYTCSLNRNIGGDYSSMGNIRYTTIRIVAMQNVVGYTGNEKVDKIAREMRDEVDFIQQDQAILDRHYNAKHYQDYKETGIEDDILVP